MGTIFINMVDVGVLEKYSHMNFIMCKTNHDTWMRPFSVWVKRYRSYHISNSLNKIRIYVSGQSTIDTPFTSMQ